MLAASVNPVFVLIWNACAFVELIVGVNPFALVGSISLKWRTFDVCIPLILYPSMSTILPAILVNLTISVWLGNSNWNPSLAFVFTVDVNINVSDISSPGYNFLF